MNIISDVGGQFDALLRLVKKMPSEPLLFVGDLVDRGPKSKEVVDFVMDNGHRCLLGNHEHMMIDYQYGCEYYGPECWLANGGGATLYSYGGFVPAYIVNYLERLPRYMVLAGDHQETVLVTHAFGPEGRTLEEAQDMGTGAYDSDETILWNREPPVFRWNDYDLQIAGHNSYMGLRRFLRGGKPYGICLDDSRHGRLTGYHLPTDTVYQEAFP